MYILTQKENSIESGVYASMDQDGDHVIQFFVEKDDAITYTTLLEATGQSLFVTETDGDSVDALCSNLGYAYNIVQPGELVYPRIETLMNDL